MSIFLTLIGLCGVAVSIFFGGGALLMRHEAPTMLLGAILPASLVAMMVSFLLIGIADVLRALWWIEKNTRQPLAAVTEMPQRPE